MTLVSQNFRNNKPLPKYLSDRKLKMSAVFTFEIKDAKKNKIFNILKACFFVMGAPMDIIFDLFLCDASKKYNFAIFFQDVAKIILI